MTTASPIPPRTLACARCGATFDCNLAGGCWCNDETFRLPMPTAAAADCLYRSAVAGTPTTVPGDLDTLMAGLAAGEVSRAAWPVLEAAASDFVTVPDAAAIAAMRLLAEGIGGDPRLVGGEAGVGGLAGLIAAAADPAACRALGLDPAARILLVGSEGDTDPALYREIVGRAGDAVRAT